MSGSQARYPVPMPPPVGAAAPPYGARSGVSVRGRALPIVVACGLAMGVFGGLVVVRGVDQTARAPASMTKPIGSHPLPVSAPPAATPPTATGSVASPTATASEPSSTAPASPSPASPAPASAASASPASPAPASPSPATSSPASGSAGAERAVVTFDVRPRRAHVFVDGSELSGTTAEVPLVGGSAVIEVVIKSHGYKSYSESHTIRGDETIEVSLRDKPKSGPGGLLDIR